MIPQEADQTHIEYGFPVLAQEGPSTVPVDCKQVLLKVIAIVEYIFFNLLS